MPAVYNRDLMREYLAKIDTDTTGKRWDVTPLFADRASFTALVEDLARPFRDEKIDVVVAIDALGFILGTAVANALAVGLVPARKSGKLPVDSVAVEFIDYSGTRKALEMRTDALGPGMRVLLVDEWIETGAQAAAAIDLVERLGARIVGIATINVDSNPRTEEICTAYRVHSVWADDT